jgi:hypothetical protein
MVLTASPTAARTGDGDDELVVAAPASTTRCSTCCARTRATAGRRRPLHRARPPTSWRRADAELGGTVAGRFWIDRESGLLLRREVFDEGAGGCAAAPSSTSS